MPLVSLLRQNVEIGATARYDRLIRFIAERARQDKAAAKWSAYLSTGSEGRQINYVQNCEGFAELVAIEQPEAMIRRLFGEGDGNALLESLGQGIRSSSYNVSRVREDISSPIAQAAGPPALVMVTRLRAASGEAEGLEELIRQVVEAAAKVDDKRRYIVLQTAVGDLATYTVIQPVADPAELDSQAEPVELLAQVHGEKEGRKIFSKGTECIDDAQGELTVLVPELSNLP